MRISPAAGQLWVEFGEAHLMRASLPRLSVVHLQRRGSALALLIAVAARRSACFSLVGSPWSSSSRTLAKIAKQVSIWEGESFNSSQYSIPSSMLA
jgi:hypothetical protein